MLWKGFRIHCGVSFFPNGVVALLCQVARAAVASVLPQPLQSILKATLKAWYYLVLAPHVPCVSAASLIIRYPALTKENLSPVIQANHFARATEKPLKMRSNQAKSRGEHVEANQTLRRGTYTERATYSLAYISNNFSGRFFFFETGWMHHWEHIGIERRRVLGSF